MTLTDRLNGINLYLIGMMGAGKSSTGAVLAQALGYQFFDTDAVVEAAAGQTVAKIFDRQGEAAFRQMETNVLAELSTYRRLVWPRAAALSPSGKTGATCTTALWCG